MMEVYSCCNVLPIERVEDEPAGSAILNYEQTFSAGLFDIFNGLLSEFIATRNEH